MFSRFTNQATDPRRASRQGAERRRGLTSVLAMVYLIIFSALALGFYATTSRSAQVSGNERRGVTAMTAVESGLQFLRYELSRLDIPQNQPLDSQFEEIYMQLSAHLDPTANLGGSVVGWDGTSITIPKVGYVNVDPSGKQRFRVKITRAGDVLVADFIGRSDGAQVARGLEVKFTKAQNATKIFNFGVASRGSISTSGTSTITGATDSTKGSVLSTAMVATPVSVFGKEVSGDISIVNRNGNVTFGSNVKIGGTDVPSLIRASHIHKDAEDPRFPDVDTTVYGQYAKNPYVDNMSVLDNVRVPAGKTVTLKGGDKVRGVLYLEKGANLSVTGNVEIQAVIVSAPDATAPVVSGNTITNNVIDFTGSVTAKPLGELPDADPFKEVRKLQGAFIIAPNYRVRMWGNFGTVGGSIIAGQFQMGGSAEGTVKGSVIQTTPLPTTIDGSADVIIASVGTTEYPPGVTFGAHYTAVPGSYTELKPDENITKTGQGAANGAPLR